MCEMIYVDGVVNDFVYECIYVMYCFDGGIYCGYLYQYVINLVFYEFYLFVIIYVLYVDDEWY